jgi:DNA-binding transcriptional regulator YhcF (GntR family)
MSQKLVHGDDDSVTRTSFYDAIMKIMKLLSENQKSYSIASLARESKIHRRTIQKSIELLENLEGEYLENFRIKLQKVDNKKIIALERRTGLLSYPEEVQKFIIKSKYFPLPSEETYMLVHLYLRNAKSSKDAIEIKGGKYSEKIINKLLKQGQLIKTTTDKENRLYLSAEGIVVAKGALQIYPELEKQKDNNNI